MPRKSTVKTAEAAEVKTEAVQAEPVQAETKAPAAKRQYKVKERKFSPNELVVVRNGFEGKLVYVSPRTGEKFVWDELGSELDMELVDLRAAKNAHKGYFENNWFVIDDEEVLEYLGVKRMYQGALSTEEIEKLFKMAPEEIEEKLNQIPKGQKQTIIYRAKRMIVDGEIDSIKVIRTLEKCLGVELIEK